MDKLLYTTNGGKKNLPRVECIKCRGIGNLTIKKTKSHGTTYEYYYVQHYVKESDKIEWCYLGSYGLLPEDYRGTSQKDKAIHNNTQNYTQTENPDLNSISRKEWTGGDLHLIPSGEVSRNSPLSLSAACARRTVLIRAFC
jgi:hypothetical protein